MATDKVRVAVIGASGYAGVELARLLAGHPLAHLAIATASGERAGVSLSELFPSLRGICDVRCREVNTQEISDECDFAFLALPHGKAMGLVPQLLDGGLKVCDIGADFRLRDAAVYEQWYKLPHNAKGALSEAVYGLPEWNRSAIKTARLVANPGCYPTSAILALAPLVAAGLIDISSIVVDSASGSSGAGRSSYGPGLHHPEVSEDFKAYGVGSHRHTPEIEQGLADAMNAPPADVTITFTPHLLPIARGILSTCYANLKTDLDSAGLQDLLGRRYADELFVRVSPAGQTPQIKHVAGSNFCDIGALVDARARRAIVIAALDNLTKGAAGQAIQNMNLMCGLDETLGLWGAPVFPLKDGPVTTMLTLGVIADTHIRAGGKCQLPEEVFRVFSGVDIILHAGDLNTLKVLGELEAIAPVVAVHGNNCDWDVIQALPGSRLMNLERCTIGMVHGNRGSGGDTSLKALSHFTDVDCVVFGHSHWPMIAWRTVGQRPVLLFNPGSPTDPRRAPHPSCGLLRIDGTKLEAELVTW